MAVREPINLKELMEGGTIFNVDLDSIKPSDDEDNSEETVEYNEMLTKFSNYNVAGEFDLADEETYADGQPFEIIAKKMVNITGKGEVKKRIIREGYGTTPSDLAIVKVHYNGYLEYQVEPYDTTYARRSPHVFTVNNGEVIIGLDIAVQSMKLNEKSQFLIKPEFAFGTFGCLDRIPANSTILFEVELLEIIDAGAAEKFQKLSEDKQKDFSEVYKYCQALCTKGKDSFRKNIRNAIKEFNTAACKLEDARLSDYSDQEKQQELLMRVYSNLLVCYTNVEEPKKGCINFNKMINLVKGTDIKISAKAYYNNAKCLRMLGDYSLAKRRLQKAHEMEPHSTEIANEFLHLEHERQESLKKQKELGKALMNSAK